MRLNINLRMNNINRIIREHGLDRDGEVVRFIRDTADRLMNPFIPTTGGDGAPHLRGNKTYPSNSEIKYTNPYAKYQYYGKLMLAKNGSAWAKLGENKALTSKSLKYHTSGTGPKWNELMMQRRKNDLIKDIENFIKNGGR